MSGVYGVPTVRAADLFEDVLTAHLVSKVARVQPRLQRGFHNAYSINTHVLLAAFRTFDRPTRCQRMFLSTSSILVRTASAVWVMSIRLPTESIIRAALSRLTGALLAVSTSLRRRAGTHDAYWLWEVSLRPGPGGYSHLWYLVRVMARARIEYRERKEFEPRFVEAVFVHWSRAALAVFALKPPFVVGGRFAGAVPIVADWKRRLGEYLALLTVLLDEDWNNKTTTGGIFDDQRSGRLRSRFCTRFASALLCRRSAHAT